MKTLGIIGGMSWESSALYYSGLNREARARLGGLASARLILNSLEFSQIAQMQHDGDWDGLEALLVQEAQALEKAGAELLIIATNTMHLMFEQVAEAVSIPLIHIADGTGQALVANNYKRPLLLATGFTMEKDFYKGRLLSKFGIECETPNAEDRAQTHRIIYEELCKGQVSSESQALFKALIKRYPSCDSVILGCTELVLSIDETVSALPLIDTTSLHVTASFDAMLA